MGSKNHIKGIESSENGQGYVKNGSYYLFARYTLSSMPLLPLEKEPARFEIWSLIAEARKDAGLTQSELAKKAQTAQPAISRYEKAEVLPDLGTLKRILEACGHRLQLASFPRSKDDPPEVLERLGEPGHLPAQVLFDLDDDLGKSGLAKWLQLLSSYEIDFILIGSAAHRLVGRVCPVGSIDVIFKADEKGYENLEELFTWVEKNAQGQLVTDECVELNLPPSASEIERYQLQTWNSTDGLLRLMVSAPAASVGGLVGFDELGGRARSISLASVLVKTACLEDLIDLARGLRRPKELAALKDLLEIFDLKPKQNLA